MSMFEWKQAFCIGHTEIDIQHRRLFEIANELHTAMAAGKGKQALSKILRDLVDYTRMHFSTEERLMKAHGFPEYREHKSEHDALTAKVIAFQHDFESGHILLTVGLMQFLKDWLQHHIGESDRKIAEFLGRKAA